MLPIPITSPNRLPKGRELIMMTPDEYAHTRVRGKAYELKQHNGSVIFIDPTEEDEPAPQERS